MGLAVGAIQTLHPLRHLVLRWPRSSWVSTAHFGKASTRGPYENLLEFYGETRVPDHPFSGPDLP